MLHIQVFLWTRECFFPSLLSSFHFPFLTSTLICLYPPFPSAYLSLSVPKNIDSPWVMPTYFDAALNQVKVEYRRFPSGAFLPVDQVFQVWRDSVEVEVIRFNPVKHCKRGSRKYFICLVYGIVKDLKSKMKIPECFMLSYFMLFNIRVVAKLNIVFHSKNSLKWMCSVSHYRQWHLKSSSVGSLETASTHMFTCLKKINNLRF